MDTTECVSPTYIPFGVADAEGTIGVIANANGGLDKLDLKSGTAMWHCSVGVRPLLLNGKLVFTTVDSKNADVLEIVAVDLDSGDPTGGAFHFPLPDWSLFSSPDRREFSCRLSAKGSTTLVLEWTVKCGYEGGASASQSLRDEKRKRVAGICNLDMLTGRCEVLPRTSAIDLPQLSDPKFTPVSFRLGGQWSDEPFEADSTMVWLVGDESSLHLIRRSSPLNAEVQEAKLLFEGLWFSPIVTQDGSLLVVQRRTAESNIDSDWEVISLVSGRLVCRFESELQPDLCCVVGTQLLYITSSQDGETQYCSLSLDTGKLQWKGTLPQPIRKQTPPPLRR